MTGANFAVASTGDIVVCTNEGNADMGTSCPTLNIAAFGMEKIVPDMEALGVFTRLLARSATGQPITTYTSQYRNPREGGEYHIIIVDNGRSALLAHPDHIKTLNCIRCGACMNTCPVYRRSGDIPTPTLFPVLSVSIWVWHMIRKSIMITCQPVRCVCLVRMFVRQR